MKKSPVKKKKEVKETKKPSKKAEKVPVKMEQEKFSINIGDKVTITDFYASAYTAWAEQIKGKDAVVTAVKPHKVPHTSLSKDDMALYRARFGLQEVYTILELSIKIENQNYIVSDLGFQ